MDQGYKYVIYNVDEFPNMFDDCYRVRGYEVDDIAYALIHPYQHYDDDSVLVRWDKIRQIWTMSFIFGIGGGQYPKGEFISDGDKDSCERASLILLTHFGLMERRDEFPPAKIGFISPDELRKLANKSK